MRRMRVGDMILDGSYVILLTRQREDGYFYGLVCNLDGRIQPDHPVGMPSSIMGLVKAPDLKPEERWVLVPRCGR